MFKVAIDSIIKQLATLTNALFKYNRIFLFWWLTEMFCKINISSVKLR